MQALGVSHADCISLLRNQNCLMTSMSERDAQRKALGKRITELRADKGHSQAQLAGLAGIAQPSLWAIEKGETKEITASTLIAICRALGTTVEYLWDGTASGIDARRDEAELVAIYRKLDETSRRAVLETARGVLRAIGDPPTDVEVHRVALPKNPKAKRVQRF